MTFEVTATRKRPQRFDDLAGQEFVISTLKSSIKAGRVAHAYLFSGPRGVGKTSAARILARALNCEKGPTDSPCGACSSCLEIARGNALDVIEIDGASNTSVNDVRQIKDEVLFAPNSGRYKVYIIDEVHMLSNAAFNALLKTIEEPPPYIVFVFATTEVHKVPATIRSRCQQFNFRLIPVETIEERLAGLCAETGMKAEREALFWIAKEATGSLRDAYTLFDQVVSLSGKELTFELVRDRLGLSGVEAINAIAEACVSGEGKRVVELADELLMKGVSVEQLVMELAGYFRSLLFAKHGIARESLLGSALDRFSTVARESYTVSQLEQAIGLLLDLYRDLRYSLNQRFELDLVLSRLAALSGYLTPGEILRELRELRGELGRTPPAEVVPARSASPEEPPSDDLDEPDDESEPYDSDAAPPVPPPAPDTTKERVVAALRTSRPALSTAVETASEWRIEGGELKLAFDSNYVSDRVRQELAAVTEAVFSVTGEKVRISLETKSPAEACPARDEQVELVKRVFRGEVIKGGEA